MIKTYAAILRFSVKDDASKKEEALATVDGGILVGTEEQLKYLFKNMFVSVVPISDKTTVSLVFVDSPEYAGGTLFGVPGKGFEKWKEEQKQKQTPIVVKPSPGTSSSGAFG